MSKKIKIREIKSKIKEIKEVSPEDSLEEKIKDPYSYEDETFSQPSSRRAHILEASRIENQSEQENNTQESRDNTSKVRTSYTLAQQNPDDANRYVPQNNPVASMEMARPSRSRINPSLSQERIIGSSNGQDALNRETIHHSRNISTESEITRDYKEVNTERKRDMKKFF